MQKAYTKLLEESVEFLKRRISVADNEGDRDILSVACEKVKGVHRDLPDKISSSCKFIYYDIRDSKSAVIKELSDVCNKLSDLSIRAGIQDHLASLRDDEDDIICAAAAAADDDVDSGEIRVYLQKKCFLTQEIKLYNQTIDFLDDFFYEVGTDPDKDYDPDLSSFLHANYMISIVSIDLSCTRDADMSSSVWNQDLPLMISKSRSQVENHLHVLYDKISNPTYKGDVSNHLAAFKKACLVLPELPSQILDSSLDYTEWKRMSSRSGNSGDESGSGICKSLIDIPEDHEADDDPYSDYYYRYRKCCAMEEYDEDWDPEYERLGIGLIDPSALRDHFKDELHLGYMSEESSFSYMDELDQSDMSEGSPLVHPEDEVILHL